MADGTLSLDPIFARDGAQHFAGAALPVLDALFASLAQHEPKRGGTRLRGVEGLAALLSVEGPIGDVLRRCGQGVARPVRAILFDKNQHANWALGWHQDRTIAVTERRDVPGFGPWTVKAGMVHVAPPFELLANMITLRVHLDPVPRDNAPLLVAPGSHRSLLREDAIAAEVARCGVLACTAAAGDVWAYATPILHASDAARCPARRRVLQIDYSAETLPGGLEWLGL